MSFPPLMQSTLVNTPVQQLCPDQLRGCCLPRYDGSTDSWRLIMLIALLWGVLHLDRLRVYPAGLFTCHPALVERYFLPDHLVVPIAPCPLSCISGPFGLYSAWRLTDVSLIFDSFQGKKTSTSWLFRPCLA